jgi:hypothetical protein
VPVRSRLPDHPVRRTLKLIVAENLHDISNVGDNGALDGPRWDPAIGAEDLQAANIVL